MNRFLQTQTLQTAILQKKTLINWGVLASLILVFMLSATSSYATCYGNVTDGGEIGSDQTICSGESVTLTNEELPSGGIGTLEYMWLSNTVEPAFNGSTGVPSSSPTYNTGSLTETTWFRRCSRRAGCSSWNYGESNWIKITVGNAVLEHVDGVDETACDANDGKIITDPFINQGTALPYSVEYTYNGQTYSAGPYATNEDHYITGLAPGIYSNITIHDANGCSSVWGSDITIAEYNTGCTPPTVVKTCELTDYNSRLLWLNFDNTGVKEYAVDSAFIVTEYSDGTATITGTATQVNNSNNTWQVNVKLLAKRTWSEWSALGRSYKPNNYISYEDHTTWSYYELDNNNSTFTGLNGLAGKSLNITHNPSDYEFGFQVGLGANLKDGDEGFSGWFAFTGSYTGHGDFNGDFDCNISDCNQLLLEYTGDCNDPDDSLYPTILSNLISNATEVAPVNGPSYASCDDNIICINTLHNSWDFEVTSQSDYTFNNIVAQFLYPIDFNTAGGAANSSNCNTTFAYTVSFYKNDILIETKTGSVPSDIVTSVNIAPTNPILTSAGDKIKVWIQGNPVSPSCALFELAGLKYKGCPTETASVGDWVFNDANGNGIQEAGEFGLPGVPVILINTDDNSSDTTTTNPNGNYEFPNIIPGNYKVIFPEIGSSNSLNYNLTPANQGTDSYKDSDPIPMNDGSGNAMTQIFIVNAGDHIDTIDAGYYIGSKITGIAFIETDVDGLQDGTETRLPGVPVMLLDENGNMIASTTTDNDGLYEFENLAPGNYKVKFPEDASAAGTDYSLTRSEVGADDDIDSDAVPMNDGSGNAMTQIVYVQNGDTIDNLDAGYFPLAKIGNRVFQDVNENGIQDIDDVAYSDVNIMLIGTDIFGNAVNETTTPDSDGFYSFTNVVPGTYELKFTSNQVTFIPTIKDFSANGFDEDDSDISNAGRTDLFTINAGEVNNTLDAGFIYDSSLPVELISFEAQLVNGNQVLLKWSTASEINNRHFVVQRSADGVDFRPIGLVEGNGTTTLVNHYSLDDSDPFYGANYYRLKQVDYNGDSEYSPIETVIVSGDNVPDVIVYPNPVMHTTTLRVVTPFETDAQIEIINQAGKVIKVITMEAGANSKQLDLSDYTAGIYYAYINYNGHRKLVHNIVKVDE